MHPPANGAFDKRTALCTASLDSYTRQEPLLHTHSLPSVISQIVRYVSLHVYLSTLPSAVSRHGPLIPGPAVLCLPLPSCIPYAGKLPRLMATFPGIKQSSTDSQHGQLPPVRTMCVESGAQPRLPNRVETLGSSAWHGNASYNF